MPARRTWILVAVVVLALVGRSTEAQAAAGDLDPTFGVGGIAITSLGAYNDQALAITTQSDGKILVAGLKSSSFSSDFALIRYNPGGSLDTTFGTGGVVTTDVAGATDSANWVGVQPDGKILAAGSAFVAGGGDFALIRYNPDGSPDATFGTGGIVTTAISANDEAIDAALQPDGRIVLAGTTYASPGPAKMALVRYNSDGSLDTTFGTGGKVVTTAGVSNSYATSVALQSDGKIVTAGWALVSGNDNFALVRYNTDGSLDTTFGTGGKVTTLVAPFARAEAYAMAIQPDGRIVVGGGASAGSPDVFFALVRYTSSGGLDPSFGSEGVRLTPMSTISANINAIALQSDGKIVATGSYVNDLSGEDSALARYTTSGNLDPAFASTGLASSYGSRLDSVTIQSDDKLSAAGFKNASSGTDIAVLRYDPGVVGPLPSPSTPPPPPPPPPPPSSSKSSTTLSIKAPRSVPKGSKATIKGRLSSSSTPCIASQTIVFKGVPARATTSSAGSYKVSIKITKRVTVQASFKGTSSCSGSTSPKKTINVGTYNPGDLLTPDDPVVIPLDIANPWVPTLPNPAAAEPADTDVGESLEDFGTQVTSRVFHMLWNSFLGI